jgi:Flp pilus assembly protein CpaB
LFTTSSAVGPGEAVVGASLAPGELPTATLRPGDSVLAIDVSDANGGAVAEATVFGVSALTTQGGQFVSLRVTESDATKIARAAAGGHLRLLLVSAERVK